MKFFTQLRTLSTPETATLNSEQETASIDQLFETYSDPFYSQLLVHSVCLHPFDSEMDSSLRESRLRRHISSIGKHHRGPYLTCEYGFGSEAVQAFCRSVAVYGGITILSAEIVSKDDESVENSTQFKVTIEDGSDGQIASVNGEQLGKVTSIIQVKETRYHIVANQ